MNPIFETLELAEAYFDDEPAASSILANVPRSGMFTVVLRKEPEYGDWRDLAAAILRDKEQWQQADREEYESNLLRAGALQVGAEIAAERGLTGDSAVMFAKGMVGEHAKAANPRAFGLEPVFRAGRKAKDDREVQRRVRVAAHGMRAGFPFSRFVKQKYYCGVIPYCLQS